MTKIEIIEKIINLIYPPVCAFCGKLDNNYLCENCKKEVKKLEKTHIKKYNVKNIYYDEHIYVFKYEDFIRNKILNYKFSEKSYYYKTFVKILLNNKKICEILKSYDIIVPVPIHNKRRKERGYNQTELIAKEIVKELKQKEHLNNWQKQRTSYSNKSLQYLDVLHKKINTKPQSTLNKKNRIENTKNVYELKNRTKPDDIKLLENKNILIFDDIYTTGSTVNECAKVIEKFNVNKIGILTIAKD